MKQNCKPLHATGPVTVVPGLRDYPENVTLLERHEFHRDASTPLKTTDIEQWLLGPAGKIEKTVELIEEFAGQLARACLGVVRLTLNIGTLHPQAVGYAWNWNLLDGVCDEILLGHEVLTTDAYRKNPLSRTMEFGVRVEVPLGSDLDAKSGSLMLELRDQGFTEYTAIPLSTRNVRSNAVTLATQQPGGFTGFQKFSLDRLMKIFALHVERHVADRISENVANAYLGREAGRRVLSGTIKRGAGKPVQAVVWSSDMRGFSGLSERLDSRIVASVLDRYFSVMADAVVNHGGDVLKFIGDGMLAVFPLTDFTSQQRAVKAAVDAAREAVAQLEALNGEKIGTCQWPELQTGIGLDVGEVLFGNIGSERRLDFTVVGKAVNVASRIEGFCKPLGKKILMSSAVASVLDDGAEDVGTYTLNGISNPERLYALNL